MANQFIPNTQIREHLEKVSSEAGAAGKKLRVMLQDDPQGIYLLESAELQGEQSVMLNYRSAETGDLYSASVSADEEAEGHVRLTPEGLKGRDEDGEMIEVRRTS